MDTESLRTLLGGIAPHLDDDSVSEILINGTEDISIERSGRLSSTHSPFTGESLLQAAQGMAQLLGQQLSEQKPRLDARMPDGTRIHIVLPPIARRGVTISIRKPFRNKLTLGELLKLQALTPPMARLMEAASRLKLNIIVAGQSGSGQTTLLKVISSLIPAEERILTLEDSAELQLEQAHVVAFQSRPPDELGKGGVDLQDLLASAFSLRPDRIVVGELRGPECFHLIQALDAGRGAGLATCYANTPTDALRRLEAMCLVSAGDLPIVAVRALVASAIQLIVCCERLPDHSRKVTAISEVLPLDDGGNFRVQDLFVFAPVFRADDGEVVGYHAPTGLVPSFAPRARALGLVDLDDRFFDPATYDLPAPPVVQPGQSFPVRWAPSLKHREQGLADPGSLQEKWATLERRLKGPSEPKVELSPDLLAELDGMGASFEIPAPRPPASPSKS